MNQLVFSNCFRFLEISLESYHHTDHRCGSPQHYIAYMETGRCRIVSDAHSIEIREGDVFHIPMGLPYQSYWYGDPEIRYRSYGFSFFPDAEQKNFILQKIECDPPLKNQVRSIPIVLQSADSRILGEFYDALALLVPLMKTEPVGQHELIYRTIRKHIYDHPEARAAEIAHLCGVSETTLYTACKAVTGKTPNCIRQEILAEKASLLLTTTNQSVQEISDCLGFSSASYFRKTLKKVLKKTPREIRKGSLIV